MPSIKGAIDCDSKDARLLIAKDLLTDADADGYAFEAASKSVCLGDSIPKGTIIKGYEKGIDANDSNANCRKNAELYRDGDDDGVGAGQLQNKGIDDTIPQGYLLTSWDCNDSDPAAFTYSIFYFDQDKDGYTTEKSKTFCAESAPAGFSLKKPILIDCDDKNPNAHSLRYDAEDIDLDAYPDQKIRELCYDNKIHRSVTSFQSGSIDCDPNDKNKQIYRDFYKDKDGDTYAGEQSEPVCTSKAYVIPAGYAELPNDCDDENPALWTLTELGTDLDKDGYTLAIDLLCIGQVIPNPYVKPSSIPDCNDRDQTVWRWMPAYLDQDGDGIGVGQSSQQCIGQTAPASWSLRGYDPNDKDPKLTEEDTPLYIFEQ